MELRRTRFLRYIAVQRVVMKHGGVTQLSFGFAWRAESKSWAGDERPVT